ncbi:MAG: hypothetical protein J6Y03_06465 [Alphaproteobacteria bacterium]|nr:hypothetical protein [Alphaproteobacteria bacterium]
MKKILLALLFCFVCFGAFAKNYSYVDSRAEKVPAKYEESLPKLVQYLIEPFSDNEENKARVLMAWIVYHIDYDEYKMESITKTSYKRHPDRVNTGDIFETRVGVCSDIANLYQRMAGLAGLDSVIITGYAGNDVTRRNMEKNRHAWNAVKIDGKWEFVDPTWAIKGQSAVVFQDVNSRVRHDLEMKKRERNAYKTNKTRKNRRFDERWFMTEPREMIKTHFPDDEKWQLLPSPKRIGSFLK